MIQPPPYTKVESDPDKHWVIEERHLRIIEKLGERLNEPTPMNFDERRDWANWINQCLANNAITLDSIISLDPSNNLNN